MTQDKAQDEATTVECEATAAKDEESVEQGESTMEQGGAGELSEYDKIRQVNIAEREAMLASLDLVSEFAALKKDFESERAAKKARPKKRRKGEGGLKSSVKGTVRRKGTSGVSERNGVRVNKVE